MIKWAFRNIKKDGQERDATSFDGHSKGGCRGWGSRVVIRLYVVYIVHRTPEHWAHLTPPCPSLSKFQGSLSTLGSAPRFLRVSTCHHPVVQLLPCQAPIILIRAYLFKSECEKDELRLSSFGYLSEVLESFTLGTICLLQITCVETDRTGKEPPVIPLRRVCSCIKRQ